MKKGDFLILLLIISVIYFLSKAIGKDENSKHLANLDPSVRNYFRQFLNDIISMGGTPVIRDSRRSRAMQQYYYNKDHRNAKPGHGLHEIGEAIDMDVYINGILLSKNSPKKAWEITGIPALAINKYGMRWGGNFKGYPDNNHYELLT